MLAVRSPHGGSALCIVHPTLHRPRPKPAARRLRPQSRRPAAKRHDRRGDDRTGDLWITLLAPDAQQEDRALAAAAGLLLHFGEFYAALRHPAVEHALGHPPD